MISCDTVKSLLSDYLDLAVNPDLRRQIDAHLQACTECQKVYTDVQLITRHLRSSEVVQVSPDFNQKLRARIMEAGTRREHSINLRSLSFGVSGAVVVAAVSFFALSELSTPSATINNAMQRQMQPEQKIVATHTRSEKAPSQETILANSDVQKDSLKKMPETVDKNRIKLVDQGR